MGDFNPRSRVGNDCPVAFNVISIGISIHVPAWGTTWILKSSSACFLFQSTFPRGERRESCLNHPFEHRKFQSTFPRGERHNQNSHAPLFHLFQSTFPRGERPEPLLKLLEQLLFQSTFPRGERQVGGKVVVHV